MGYVGVPELLIVLALILILAGPGRLARLAAALRRDVQALRKPHRLGAFARAGRTDQYNTHATPTSLNRHQNRIDRPWGASARIRRTCAA